ncbi:MAG: hypothetical protein MJ113_05870, partial [Lachnospiraceae bacterium]|nr:hypothetical protein [Lachnospiraceae bacterium]
ENTIKTAALAKSKGTASYKRGAVGKEKYISKSRKAFELYYPKFATNSLKLKPDWTYSQVYIAVIEKIMSVVGAEKFKIYSEDEIDEALRSFNRLITVEPIIFEEIKKQSVEQEILFNLAVMLVDDKCVTY